MGKRGPKLTEVDWDTVDEMCSIHCTGEEMASILKVDYDTLQRACKRDHDVKFADYIRQKGSNGKMSLRRRQYTAAMEGNTTMLVWLGKNWLGQTDGKTIDESETPEPLTINIGVKPAKGEVQITNAKSE